MKKYLFNLIMFVICFNSNGQKLYSKKELTEDIQYFFKTIKDVHIDAYFYSKDIDSINKMIINDLPEQLEKDSF